MIGLDAKVIYSIVGIIFCLLFPQQPKSILDNVSGYGIEVSVIISAESVEIGVDPRVSIYANLPGPIVGITLGNIILTRKSVPIIPPEFFSTLDQYERYQVNIKSFNRTNLLYEWGHFQGYQYYGVAYPIYAIGMPKVYDPRIIFSSIESETWKRYKHLGPILYNRHSLFSIRWNIH